MKTDYVIRDGVIVEASGEEGRIVVYSSPDEAEKRQLIESLGLDAYDLESALDPDEISRLELGAERLSLIWKRPKNSFIDERLFLDVASIGLFLYKDRLVVIMSDDSAPFWAKEFLGVQSSIDVLLRLLLHTVRHYLGHLKVIKQLTVDLESKITTSMENRYLVRMFSLSESLIYYQNAIEANGAVLKKLQTVAERLNLTRQQIEFLDDIVLDNRQCTRQAQIHSSVLSGLMDARGSIINNNMNVQLKNLTIINIIFLPLNLLASIGGMSEYSMMTSGIDWRLSYPLFTLAMALIGWATWKALNTYVDKGTRRVRS